MSDKPVKRKVLAYITHGDRLLVFRHVDAPAAGVQVPAGTLQDGEPPEVGVLREAVEETGLTGLSVVSYLGDTWIDWSSQGVNAIHHRRFYHLRCDGQAPETWQHAEMDSSEGVAGPIWFELWWARMPDDVPQLSGQQGALLPQLYQHLSG